MKNDRKIHEIWRNGIMKRILIQANLENSRPACIELGLRGLTVWSSRILKTKTVVVISVSICVEPYQHFIAIDDVNGIWYS